ncbi:lymphocyte-specific protein 1 isoform X3 [Trachemys scripta elegans]|uniref:lymphocyte-specific protein 1 isoform X3 n=1 Tax=Trachemys scripta elegans TaxID=31138 RepID=UPI001557FF24|nr:lymphocyte-specific protein 1 isoform X3 [Trachemys scripta elegans]
MSDSEECHGDPESKNQEGEEPPTDTERLTAQWSVEDEEEAARERRRREREKQQRSQAEDGLNNTNSFSESGLPVQENQSPRHSYEEEDSGLREAEVKLEQVQLNQEGPEEIPGEKEEIRQEPLETEEPQQLVEEECIPEQKQEEEEEEKAGQEEKKRRRNEEAETPEKRQKAPSTSSVEGEEGEQCDGQSPTSSTTITDRTESLNRSIKKSNSVKKTQPPLPVSKIDDRLEQYTHAIETSEKVPKLVRQSSLELATTSMVVASTKSLWETGEVAAQSSKSPSCKDIVAGDIVNKRSMWEQKGTPKNEGNIKTTASGKKYKFVATGHGQYKKVLIDDATEQ